MPRRVHTSDSEEEERQRSSNVRKTRRITSGSQNPRDLPQPDGVSDSEEAEESPKGKKRARANTVGDSHQVKDEAGESSRSGNLTRDTDG